MKNELEIWTLQVPPNDCTWMIVAEFAESESWLEFHHRLTMPPTAGESFTKLPPEELQVNEPPAVAEGLSSMAATMDPVPAGANCQADVARLFVA